MIIRLLLIGLLCIVAAYAMLQRRRSPWAARLIVVCAALGSVLVLFPDMASQAARVVGVGRGVDLIFYLFIVLGLAVSFNIHLRLRQMSQTMTRLVREIAILESKKAEGN